jgi:ABC-type nickel/cobalt efflux system permease component RcnA
MQTILIVLDHYNNSIDMLFHLDHLNVIATSLLLSLGRYFCWWTISPRWYQPPSMAKHGLLDIFITEKVQKDKQRSTKHTHKTKDRVTGTPLKIGGEPR